MATEPTLPFLFLSIRAEEEATADEYAAMFRFTGLDEAGLHRVRLDHGPLGPVDVDRWSGIILGGGSYTVSNPAESKSEDQHRVKCDLSTCWTRSSSATSRSSAWRLPTS